MNESFALSNEDFKNNSTETEVDIDYITYKRKVSQLKSLNNQIAIEPKKRL